MKAHVWIRYDMPIGQDKTMRSWTCQGCGAQNFDTRKLKEAIANPLEGEEAAKERGIEPDCDFVLIERMFHE